MNRAILLLILASAGIVAFTATLGVYAAPPPAKDVSTLQRQNASLSAKAARLSAQSKILAQQTRTAQRREAALLAYITAQGTCPISRPSMARPLGTSGDNHYGSDPLWVHLPPGNVVVGTPEADGAVATKFPWWLTTGGALTVTGKRLGASAPPLEAQIAPGYGGAGTQPTRLRFPVPGCWQVTGHLGDASLTFVTLALAG
jgi:hypothetical protein